MIVVLIVVFRNQQPPTDVNILPSLDRLGSLYLFPSVADLRCHWRVLWAIHTQLCGVMTRTVIDDENPNRVVGKSLRKLSSET